MAQRELVQERAQVTRDKLLKAAIALFAERGYDAVGTRDIEAEAGVNRGLITYHFGSKETLWKAAIEALFDDQSEDLALAQRNADGLDPVAKLADVIRRFVEYSAQRPELNRIMVQEGKHDDWRLAWIVDRHVKPYYATTKRLYDDVVAQGVAPAMDHVHFHYILVGAAALIFAMAPECRRLSGREPTDPKMVASHADALVRLLLPGAHDETRNVHARSKDANRPGGRRRTDRPGGRRTGAADGHEDVPRGRRRRVAARSQR
jgi:AcrR family transcriptional regulator